MTTRRISIYYANTGGGHKSAAGALAAAIRAQAATPQGEAVRVTVRQRSIAEDSHPVNKHLVRFYNYLARHHTTWIKYFYRFIHLLKPDSDIFYSHYREYLQGLLKQDRPDLVVLVHPMLPSCISWAMEEMRLKPRVKLAVVVTDPNENLWRGWASDRADLIVAPNNVARDRLIDFGVSPEKVKVMGMPIHPKFLSPPSISRNRFLKKLGLSPDTLTVCVNASWAGNSHWLKVYEALKHCRRKLQVVFLCGHNLHLQYQVRAAAQDGKLPTAVLEFNNKIPELMNAVDLMVTKSGGLTTYEALARRLPMVLDNTIEPMPQEAPTMRMLIESGLAEAIDRPEEIVPAVEMLAFPVNREGDLPRQYQFDLTDHGVFDIAHALLQMCAKEEKVSEPSLKEVA